MFSPPLHLPSFLLHACLLVISRIVDIQSSKVQDWIPNVRTEIYKQLKLAELDLAKLPPAYHSPEERRAFFLIWCSGWFQDLMNMQQQRLFL
jgi:hypothetical protein